MAKKPVQVIEKKPSETAPPKKQQVAAYCRVSTMAEEQQSSLKLQVEYYTKYIKANSDWSFACVYADRMSGISAKDRPEFQKLIRKCMAGKVDLILCKSVSRFGRNLIETLNILEKLKKHHVGVWFEDIQANSLDPRVFAALTIFSLHAQEESIAKAQNVHKGIAMGFANGTSGFASIPCYGYRRNEEGNLYVNHAEAYAVRKIFEWYLDGESLQGISKLLHGEQIKSPSGNEKWNKASIKAVLQNRKYTGDVLLQQTYTEDTLTRKKKKNCGQLQQYVYEDNHPAIIDKETYFSAQKELERRSEGLSKNGTRYRSKGLTGLIVCEECGRPYRRVARKRANGMVYVWRCANRLENGNKICKNSPTIHEEELKQRIMEKLNLVEWDEKMVRKQVKAITVTPDNMIMNLNS